MKLCFMSNARAKNPQNPRSSDLLEALAFLYSRISRFLSFSTLGKLSDCLPPETRILLDSLLNTRSFAIYNPKERKPGFRRAARKKREVSGKWNMPLRKKVRGKLSLFLFHSFLLASFPWWRQGARQTSVVNFRSLLERIVPHRERECKRAAFLQPRVDSGFISEERRPVKCKKVREKFRGEFFVRKRNHSDICLDFFKSRGY